jgi:hypothetical protein
MSAQTFTTAAFRAPAATTAGRANERESHLDFDLELEPTRAKRRLRVPKQEVADLTAQLAIMTKSGLDLASALSSLAAQCERPLLAAVLQDINELVLSGNTLSESLRQHPEVFDGAYVATIAAAEASGRMAEVLQQLAQMQRNEMRLRSSIKSLMTYPVLLVLISSAAICRHFRPIRDAAAGDDAGADQHVGGAEDAVVALVSDGGRARGRRPRVAIDGSWPQGD